MAPQQETLAGMGSLFAPSNHSLFTLQTSKDGIENGVNVTSVWCNDFHLSLATRELMILCGSTRNLDTTTSYFIPHAFWYALRLICAVSRRSSAYLSLIFIYSLLGFSPRWTFGAFISFLSATNNLPLICFCYLAQLLYCHSSWHTFCRTSRRLN